MFSFLRKKAADHGGSFIAALGAKMHTIRCVTALAMVAIASIATPATEETIMATIQDFRDGISGVHVRNSDLRIETGEHPETPNETILLVDYPLANADPAGRDVWCDAIDKDWSVGTAILLTVKPQKALRLSISFLGRNGVAYTSWFDLKGGEWQIVRIRFDELQPNPYFQPPGSDKDSPIDVSEVERIGFAPQSPEKGKLMVGKISVVD